MPFSFGARLAELAVLAAAAVDGRMADVGVAARLAGDAGAHARDGLAALGRDRLAAIVAFFRAFALGEEGAGELNRILDGVVDLILNRAVARPPACHGLLHPCCSNW